MHNLGEQHMNVIICILRYLKSTPGKGIIFSKNTREQTIEVYTNADWARDKGDKRSTLGYFTFIYGNLVTWRRRKQNVIARSSGKAKLRGLALGICEGL